MIKGVTLDLRPRCKRCGKIPRSKAQKGNYETYYPGYCSFNCQEWHRLEVWRRYEVPRSQG